MRRGDYIASSKLIVIKKSIQQAVHRKKYKVLTKIQKDVQLHKYQEMQTKRMQYCFLPSRFTNNKKADNTWCWLGVPRKEGFNKLSVEE